MLLGCATLMPGNEPRTAQAQHARAQAKLEDRLRRVEGRLHLVDAQLSVLREQGRGLRAEDAARTQVREGAENPQPRMLRLREAPYDGDTQALTYPHGQRIVTDAAGRVRLVANETPALGRATLRAGADADADAAPASSAAAQSSPNAGGATEGDKKRDVRTRGSRSKRSARERAH